MKEIIKNMVPDLWKPVSDRLFRFEAAEGPVDWKSESPSDSGQAVYSSERFSLKADLAADSEYGSLVCKLTIKNTSQQQAVLIKIEPLFLHWEPNEGPVYIRTCGGGLAQQNYPPDTFNIQTVRADRHGSVWMENGHDGRSSWNNIPLMTVCCGNSAVTAGLEWSGLWWMQGSGKADGECKLFCHIPVDNLVLKPGEELELPAAHYVFSGGGLDGASNAVRRYIKDRILPEPACGKPEPAVTYNHWFGLGPDISEDLMKAQFRKAADLGIEYAVLDAGWYGGCEEGNFQTGVGNWEVTDTDKFPDGLEPLAAYAEDQGLKFGIWFEVERAHRNSAWAQAHPDWFIDTGGDYLHINLSVPEAVDACIDTVQKTIDSLDVKWVKLDYNIGPKRFWEKQDPTGKIQFPYIKGLYRFFDALREKNPDLIIENCSSGGRRIDLGTMSHTHIQNLTDQTGSPEICRFTAIGANYYLPASIAPIGIPFGRKETTVSEEKAALRRYDIACRFAGSPVLYGDIESLGGEDTDRLREMIGFHREYADILNGDFFPLTPQPGSDRDCEAVQFISEDRKEILVLAYAGHEPAPREMILCVKELDPGALYAVSDAFGGSVHKGHGTGVHLMEEGFTLDLEPCSFAGLKLEIIEDA
jgi:alpha-galactosidase